ncbi:MAG: hypothetical protein A2340_12460 [Lentisphaerae bacterium RIFOXYB12_FULL_60_10]|nr:MAG: hypothetical protein A2340_12460 [Lentisphaerae bacterium RIFOXYB12_FULL_60_10]
MSDALRRLAATIRHHGCLLLPLLFYGITMSREIGLPDSAIIIDAMQQPVFSAHACNHNLNNLIGWLVIHLLPGCSITTAANFTSVLYGALAIPLGYALGVALKLSRQAALATAAVFMVSQSAWWHATRVENYLLNAIFLYAILLLAGRDAGRTAGTASSLRRHAGMAFLAGLALFNHLQNAVLLPSVAAFILVRLPANRRLRHLGWCTVAAGAGLLPYAAVLAHDLHVQGRNAIALAMGSPFHAWFGISHFLPGLRSLMELILLQFPGPFLLLIPAGILIAARKWRHPLAALILPLTVIPVIVFSGYRAWDLFSFYLPLFALLTLAGGLAWDRCWNHAGTGGRVACLTLTAISIFTPVWIYPNISQWAKDQPDGYWGRRYHAIQADYATRYDLVSALVSPLPPPVPRRIETFVKQVLTRLPPDSRWIDDVSTHHQLLLVRERDRIGTTLALNLIQPDGFPGWGTPYDALVNDVITSPADRRIFLPTDRGACGRLSDVLAGAGWRLEPFHLSRHHVVFELVRPGPTSD